MYDEICKQTVIFIKTCLNSDVAVFVIDPDKMYCLHGFGLIPSSGALRSACGHATLGARTDEDKTRQDKTRQDKTRQDKYTCFVVINVSFIILYMIALII